MTELVTPLDARAQTLAIKSLQTLAACTGVRISRDEAVQLLNEKRTITEAIRHLSPPGLLPEQSRHISPVHVLGRASNPADKHATRTPLAATRIRWSILARTLLLAGGVAAAVAAATLLLVAWRLLVR